MPNENRMTCEKFNRDLFLYIDTGLPVEQIEFYSEHLKYCSGCRKLLEETEELLALSSTALGEDIGDAKFEFMVSKTLAKKQPGLVKKFFLPEKNKKENSFRLGKIALSSVLVIIAVVVSLLIVKPYAVPAEITNSGMMDWNGEEFNLKISELSDELNGDEWNEEEAELLFINERINQLLK